MFLRILYPNRETKREIIVTSSLAGVLAYLLLIIYQPFGTSQFEHPYKNIVLLPYAIVTTFSLYSINLLFRNPKESWTIGLELVKIFLVILLTSVLSCFYNTFFVSKIDLAFGNFLSMFIYTSALGIPVSAIYLLGRYIYLDKSYRTAVINHTSNKEKAFIDTLLKENKDNSTELHIVGDNGSFQLRIQQEDFVFAESVRNYCFIHFFRNGSMHKEMIRISMTRLSSQLNLPTVKRIHRSYIVNLRKVKKYKGNASGYKLLLHNVEAELMVSRAYVDSIIPLLRSFVAGT